MGITTEAELKTVGAKQAWLKIQSIDETACIHRLLALEGAIRGVKKTELPAEVKADLKEFYMSISFKSKSHIYSFVDTQQEKSRCSASGLFLRPSPDK